MSRLGVAPLLVGCAPPCGHHHFLCPPSFLWSPAVLTLQVARDDVARPPCVKAALHPGFKVRVGVPFNSARRGVPCDCLTPCSCTTCVHLYCWILLCLGKCPNNFFACLLWITICWHDGVCWLVIQAIMGLIFFTYLYLHFYNFHLDLKERLRHFLWNRIIHHLFISRAHIACWLFITHHTVLYHWLL